MLICVAKVRVLNDFFNLMLAVLVIDFVWKIAREHERFVADGLDQMVQCFFRPLAANEDSTCLDMPANVAADIFSPLQLNVFALRIVLDMSFPTTVETLKTGLQPRHACFHET